ncbi:hypothetical protein NC99_45920 [Sunxiuqinia dokdonensis]|uniref:Uncharacterized protein n=1 Tax=Sunxiuqinia dokdonensis TaxID=1409788 RepID=A0A0L8V2F1_9BACT|nr:hypothetical protein NC99_45920 [Sunxiuqinia dokdonensis]
MCVSETNDDHFFPFSFYLEINALKFAFFRTNQIRHRQKLIIANLRDFAN